MELGVLLFTCIPCLAYIIALQLILKSSDSKENASILRHIRTLIIVDTLLMLILPVFMPPRYLAFVFGPIVLSPLFTFNHTYASYINTFGLTKTLSSIQYIFKTLVLTYVVSIGYSVGNKDFTTQRLVNALEFPLIFLAAYIVGGIIIYNIFLKRESYNKELYEKEKMNIISSGILAACIFFQMSFALALVDGPSAMALMLNMLTSAILFFYISIGAITKLKLLSSKGKIILILPLILVLIELFI